MRYFWRFGRRENFIELVTRDTADHFAEGSEEEFIAQHYWGYSSQRDSGTVEYRVEHPPWRIWQAQSCRLQCEVERLYGTEFTEALTAKPMSAFLAEGSAITVYSGRKIA